MAPTTRLRKNPQLRVDYKERQINRANSIDAPEKPKASPIRPQGLGPHARTSGIVKKATSSAKKAQKMKVERTECSICTRDLQKESFPPRKIDSSIICEHWRSACKACIGRLVAMNIEQRKLQNAELECLQPDCQHSFSFNQIKALISRKAFVR